jgi:hypothetical protein
MEERKPLEERKLVFIEPELIKFEEKLADITSQFIGSNGADGAPAPI